MNPASTPGTTGGDASGGTGHAVTADEHAEYQRLRRAATVRHRRARYAGATVLLVLTLLLAPLALVATWVHDQVADTDRYVQTVAPLASDPAVQGVVIDRLTDRVVAQVDVEAITAALTKTLSDNGAPPRVVEGSKSLTAPLRSAVHSVVERTVTRAVTSELFRQAWEGANRRAHATVVNMLTGDRQGGCRPRGTRCSWTSAPWSTRCGSGSSTPASRRPPPSRTATARSRCSVPNSSPRPRTACACWTSSAPGCPS
ncbi:hypothetical protein EV578_107198 [Streptomyces sp. BK205]|nr:hypothetical protein EV578_107198 [Streptomyces sp. BK205]